MKPKSRCLRHRRCCDCRAGAGCYALDNHHPDDGRTIRRRDLLALGVAALAARSLTLQPAVAQSKYPDRPIRLVVPFPPGGGYDAVGRPWAEKMKSVLGTVVVENQGGGGSSLGAAGSRAPERMATPSSWAARAPISPRRSSRAVRCTIRSRTSSRFRTWWFRPSPSQSTLQCRLARCESSSTMPRPIRASCLMGMLALAR